MGTPETFEEYQALLRKFHRTGLNPINLFREQACKIMERLDRFEQSYYPQVTKCDFADLSYERRQEKAFALARELDRLQKMVNPRLGRHHPQRKPNAILI